jgi:hypothetical protein
LFPWPRHRKAFVIDALGRPEQPETKDVIVLALNADEGIGIEGTQASFEGMAETSAEDRSVVCLTELVGIRASAPQKR